MIKLHIWGKLACFTRPDLKTERVSYDVITPSAAVGVLNAIHWKPAIQWRIDKIHVLNPIRMQSFKINEVKSKVSEATAKRAMKTGNTALVQSNIETDRAQRSVLALRDVGYVIEAHARMTNRAGPRDTLGKHLAMFERRARKGQCHHRPVLGLRDFSASFEWVDDEMPPSRMHRHSQEFGLMLHHFDYSAKTPFFFRARMENGVIDVAAARKEGLLS